MKTVATRLCIEQNFAQCGYKNPYKLIRLYVDLE